MTRIVARIFLLAAAAGVAGCSMILGETSSERRVDYQKSNQISPLEIPPDLSANDRDEQLLVPEYAPPSSARSSDYVKDRQGPAAATAAPVSTATAKVLPTAEKVQLMREGSTRWLLLQAEPDAVWTKTRQFWLDSGFTLKVEDQRGGFLETEWAENRGDIPQDIIRSTIGKAFDFAYSASTRDKYRVRLERGGEPGTTELYLSHRGAEEVASGETFVWQFRPSDPFLESVMLNRLMVAFGAQEERAKTEVTQSHEAAVAATAASATASVATQRSRLEKNPAGDPVLQIQENFANAWRLIGLAMDRLGFTVEDRNRADGIYYVRYVPDSVDKKDESWLTSLAFWRSADAQASETMQIRLQENGDITQAQVLNKEGQPQKPEIAEAILKLLQQQLNEASPRPK